MAGQSAQKKNKLKGIMKIRLLFQSSLYSRLLSPLHSPIYTLLVWLSISLCISIMTLTITTACSSDESQSTAVAADKASSNKSSDIGLDQHLVFFNTAASLDKQKRHWRMPIHGWVYKPQNSTVRKAIIENLFESAYDLKVSKETRHNFDRRVNLLIADNEAGNEIVISIAGQQVVLPESGSNGHFFTEILLSVADVAPYLDNDILNFSAIVSASDKRRFTGQIKLVPAEGISIISDIDDTVKISHVTDHKKLFDYTFYKDFSAAPGMAAKYQQWSKQNVSFHFVSSSPWHLYAPLREFLLDETSSDKFPWATFDLKMVRLKDESIMNLFKKGNETKPLQIEPILNRYPNRTFILIGDSGEQDPEVYAGLIRKYPTQIISIFIRNVTNSVASEPRFQQTFTGIDNNKWLLFKNPSEIKLILD